MCFLGVHALGSGAHVSKFFIIRYNQDMVDSMNMRSVTVYHRAE